MSKTKAVDAPNVLKMIVRFNSGNRWIQGEILTEGFSHPPAVSYVFIR